MTLPEIYALILLVIWWIGVLLGIGHLASPQGQSGDSISGLVCVLFWPLVVIYIIGWVIFTPEEER